MSIGGPSVLVLYKVSNSTISSGYSALRLPGGSSVTLALVKRHCHAGLCGSNPSGPDGYHWRVRVDDDVHPAVGAAGNSYFWWDIPDENEVLPVKLASQKELEGLLFPPTKPAPERAVGDFASMASAAGAIQSLGRAVHRFAAIVDGTGGSGFDGDDDDDDGMRVPVVILKLLDLHRAEDSLLRRRHRRGRRTTTAGASSRRYGYPQRTLLGTPGPHFPPEARLAPVQPPQGRVPCSEQVPTPSSNAVTASATKNPQEPLLMDLDDFPDPVRRLTPPAVPVMIALTGDASAGAEKKEDLLWDGADRSGPVTVDSTRPTPVSKTMEPQRVAMQDLCEREAQNREREVEEDAVRKKQWNALQELRERELKNREREAEEDAVRKKLEPKARAWSEEHGRKKQLRALLASLDKILWAEANWKRVGLGDLLDESKCRICYHKATLIVHPDKTTHLDAEKRFLAKRVFDALTQAKAESKEC